MFMAPLTKHESYVKCLPFVRTIAGAKRNVLYFRKLGEFPAQMASNVENASIWWRHHGNVPAGSGQADRRARICETSLLSFLSSYQERCIPNLNNSIWVQINKR